VTREAFRREAEQLKRDAGSLSDSQLRAGLKKLTALVGDGHTASRLYAEGEPRRGLPVHMFLFKEGMHVLGAAPSHADMVGGKVVSIGELGIEAAIRAVRPYASVDNEMGQVAWAPGLLVNPVILCAIGAASDESGVSITVEKSDGTRVTQRVEVVDLPNSGGGRLLTPGYTYLHTTLEGEPPLYLRNSDQPLRMEYLPAEKTMYFYFGAVQNTREASLRDFVGKVFEGIEANGAEHLVIDMRFNGGGNTGLVPPLMEAIIRSERINRMGHLWVIIGRHTFSAAQNTVNLLDEMTKAVFVGEPTGSCPQFIGESTSFVLPHSRTRVFCSSRYWQFLDSTDERTWVQPTVLAEPTFATYAANRDPALESVLELVRKPAR
jgi:hypothetical protein